jgi:hypothetical protein
VTLELGERRRRVRQRQRDTHAEHGDAELERGVEPQRTAGGLGPAADDAAPQREAAEERAHRDRHGVHVHADDERELFDPEELVDKRGEAGEDEEKDDHGVRLNAQHGAGPMA